MFNNPLILLANASLNKSWLKSRNYSMKSACNYHHRLSLRTYYFWWKEAYSVCCYLQKLRENGDNYSVGKRWQYTLEANFLTKLGGKYVIHKPEGMIQEMAITNDVLYFVITQSARLEWRQCCSVDQSWCLYNYEYI